MSSSYGRGPQGYKAAKEGDTEWLYADVFPDKLFGYEGEGNPQEAAARQVGKDTHYTRHTIQPWNIIDEYGLDYYRGNIIKYVLRNKMDVYEDMEKAKHYMDKWLEVNKGLKNV